MSVPLPESVLVLYLDDDGEWLSLVETYLEHEQDCLSVRGVNNAEVALDVLNTTPIDVVLSDFEMPDINGIDFLDQVRTDHPNIPFILYTGHESDELANEVISRGATEYMQKKSDPAHLSILANRILTVCET
jgi:DNA-binding NtrC family response regulator